MGKNQIKNTVNDLIETYGTRNPYLLASYLDVTIQYGDLGELQGCYMKIWDKKFIYINDRIEDDKLKDTVVAHELAHSIMHNEDYYFFSYGKQFQSNKTEIEAHTFAAELLIPDETIIEHPGYTLDQLSSLTGYAERLVSFKRL